MDTVRTELGFNAWTRNLDDHVVAYAFCVPEAVFHNEELREEILSWFYHMFGLQYITLAKAEWRLTSAHEDWPQNTLYEVDWCGSRSREVHIGPHLYLEFMPRLTKSRSWAEKPGLTSWRLERDEPDCYTVNYEIVPVD
jgi:hypothetical protein